MFTVFTTNLKAKIKHLRSRGIFEFLKFYCFVDSAQCTKYLGSNTYKCIRKLKFKSSFNRYILSETVFSLTILGGQVVPDAPLQGGRQYPLTGVDAAASADVVVAGALQGVGLARLAAVGATAASTQAVVGLELRAEVVQAAPVAAATHLAGKVWCP